MYFKIFIRFISKQDIYLTLNKTAIKADPSDKIMQLKAELKKEYTLFKRHHNKSRYLIPIDYPSLGREGKENIN